MSQFCLNDLKHWDFSSLYGVITFGTLQSQFKLQIMILPYIMEKISSENRIDPLSFFTACSCTIVIQTTFKFPFYGRP